MINNKRYIYVRNLFRGIKSLIKNQKNILRLKVRFKNTYIRRPLQISFTNINNIFISKKVFIDSRVILRILDSCRLFIGAGTHIGPHCHISGTKNKIIIGKNVLLAPRVYISTTNRRYDDVSKPVIDQGYVSKGDVTIEDGSWIGIGACILSGVKIGKNSIIGANSVVTRDIPPYSIAVGNPARVIRKYNFNEKKWISIDRSIV